MLVYKSQLLILELPRIRSVIRSHHSVSGLPRIRSVIHSHHSVSGLPRIRSVIREGGPFTTIFQTQIYKSELLTSAL
jgi:GMP synthase PP-ATPase subunit